MQVAVLVAVSGCGGASQENPPQPVTTTDAIFNQRHQAEKLYLTQKSFKKVIRPGSVSAPFVDPESSELCWPALMCINPACPGQGQDGFPYLFIHNDPLVTAGSQGQAVFPQVGAGQDYAQMVAAAGGFPDPTCPACYEKFRRDRAETPEETNRYANFVKEYDLAESSYRNEGLEHHEKSSLAVVSASQTGMPSHGDASPAAEQRAVELANQISRPMLKGGIQPENAAFLRQVLQESENPQVRAAIIAGLAKARDPDSVPQLMTAMTDESQELRKLAGNAVEQTCGFPQLFQADAPLEQRQEIIAQYRKVWNDLLHVPGQPYIRMMKDPEFKKEMGRRAMEKLKDLPKEDLAG